MASTKIAVEGEVTGHNDRTVSDRTRKSAKQRKRDGAQYSRRGKVKEPQVETRKAVDLSAMLKQVMSHEAYNMGFGKEQYALLSKLFDDEQEFEALEDKYSDERTKVVMQPLIAKLMKKKRSANIYKYIRARYANLRRNDEHSKKVGSLTKSLKHCRRAVAKNVLAKRKKSHFVEKSYDVGFEYQGCPDVFGKIVDKVYDLLNPLRRFVREFYVKMTELISTITSFVKRMTKLAWDTLQAALNEFVMWAKARILAFGVRKFFEALLEYAGVTAGWILALVAMITINPITWLVLLIVSHIKVVNAFRKGKLWTWWMVPWMMFMVLNPFLSGFFIIHAVANWKRDQPSLILILEKYDEQDVQRQHLTFDWFDRLSMSREAVRSMLELMDSITKTGSKILLVDRLFDVVTKLVHTLYWCATGTEWEDRHFIGWYQKVNEFVDKATTVVHKFETARDTTSSEDILVLYQDMLQLEKDVLTRKVPVKRLTAFDEMKRRVQALLPEARKYLTVSNPIVKPVGILIKGAPGAGKDTFVNFFCNELKLEKAIFPFSEQYFEAYQGQKVISCQEAFCIATVEGITEHIEKILHMLENTPQPVAKAFGDKGTVCYKSDYVFVTTNKLEPFNSGEHSMTDVGAFYRRFEVIATFRGTKKSDANFNKDYVIDIEKPTELNGVWTFTKVATVDYNKFINIILAYRRRNEDKFNSSQTLATNHVFVDESATIRALEDSNREVKFGEFTIAWCDLHTQFKDGVEKGWETLSHSIAKYTGQPADFVFDFDLAKQILRTGEYDVEALLSKVDCVRVSRYVYYSWSGFKTLLEAHQGGIADLCASIKRDDLLDILKSGKYIWPDPPKRMENLFEHVVRSVVKQQDDSEDGLVRIFYKDYRIKNDTKRSWALNPKWEFEERQMYIHEDDLLDALEKISKEQLDERIGDSVTSRFRAYLFERLEKKHREDHLLYGFRTTIEDWRFEAECRRIHEDMNVQTITGSFHRHLFKAVKNMTFEQNPELMYSLDAFIYVYNLCSPQAVYATEIMEGVIMFFKGAVVVSALYLVYKLLSRKSDDAVTEKEYHEQSEEWYVKKKQEERKEQKLMKPKQVTMQGVTLSMAAKIASQFVTFESRTSDTSRSVHGLFVNDRHVLFPYHVLGIDPKRVVEIILGHPKWNTKLMITEPKIVEFENDCCLLCLEKPVQGMQNILSHFVGADIVIADNMPMCYLGPVPSTNPILFPVNGYKTVEYNSREGHSETSNRFARVRCEARTMNGDCGSVYMLSGNSAHIDTKIYGIHTGVMNADPSIKVVSLITREELIAGMAHFAPGEVVQQSLVQKLEDSGFTITGTVNHKYYPPRKCKIVPTPIQNEFVKTNMAPAMLTPAGGISPLGNAIKDWARKDIAPLPNNRIEDLALYLEASIPDPRRLPLTATEAVCGTFAGDVKPMDLNTSAGYGFPNKKKRDLIKISGPLNLCTVEPHLEDQLEQLILDLQNGVEPKIYSLVSLKPELRKIAKVETGQTRAFCVGSLPSVILGKMLFEPIIMEYTNNPVYSKSSVGINMHGPDAGRFMQRFIYRDYNMPLDSRRNDKSVNPDHGTAIRTAHSRKLSKAYTTVTYLQLFTRKVKITDMRALVYNFLKHETTGPVVFIDVLAKPEYHIPSGIYLTAMLNKDHNEVLIADFCMEVGLTPPSATYVGTKGYGEFVRDYIASIMEESYHGDDMFNQLKKPELASIVNCVAIAKFAAWRGLTITTAVKSGDVVPFVPLEEATYLKRTFILVNGVWRAPRKLEEILEAYNWWEPGNMTWEAYLDIVIDATLVEIHHHGREVFDEWRAKFTELFLRETRRLKVCLTYDQIAFSNQLV